MGQVPFLYVDARLIAKREGRCSPIPEEAETRYVRKVTARVECVRRVVMTSYASFGRMWMTPQFFDRLAAANIVPLPIRHFR